MMETVSVLERRHEKALSYEKKKDGGKSERSGERLKRIERSELYIKLDRLTITTDEMARGLRWIGVGA